MKHKVANIRIYEREIRRQKGYIKLEFLKERRVRVKKGYYWKTTAENVFQKCILNGHYI